MMRIWHRVGGTGATGRDDVASDDARRRAQAGARVTRRPGAARRRSRWLILSGVLLVKALIIAGLVLLPSGVAISLGVTHGVVVLVVGAGVVAALLVTRRQGASSRPALAHRIHQGDGRRHDMDFLSARRHLSMIVKDREDS